MKQCLKPLTLLLTIVGGINWLIIATFDLNLVNSLFGRCCLGIEKIVYVVVGLSSIYSISLLQEMCSRCRSDNNSNKK